MKTLIKLACIAIFLFSSSAILHGASIMTNDQRAIVAIGSLSIDGTLYDISFDGSFGSAMFLGDQNGAISAGESLRALMNSYNYSSYFPWPYPTIANEAGGGYTGTGRYFEITYFDFPPDHISYPDRKDYYIAQYCAGWCGATRTRTGPNPNNVEATFRLAIPDSIPDSVPEPCGLAFISSATILLLRRKKST